MEAVPNGEQYSEADDKDSHKPNINHGATGVRFLVLIFRNK